MKPIRILHVIDCISPNSGVSAVVMNYYEHLNKGDVIFDFLVYYDVEPEIEKRLLENGSRVYVVGAAVAGNLKNYYRCLKKFFAVHSNEYEIIHGHVTNSALFYLGLAKKYGIPVRILHGHNTRGADTALKRMRNYILNHLGIRYATNFAACSYAAAKYLHGTSKNVIIIRNAIETDNYKYNEDKRKFIREELGITDRYVIGHVGRFAKQKNHDFIIELAKKMKCFDEKVLFLLVGDGEYRDNIEKKVNDNGLKNIFLFVGTVNNTCDYFQAMDVFVLPSLFEGFPVVGVEAQCNGLKCIFSSNVTEEAKVLDETQYISLDDMDSWVDVLLHCRNSRNVSSVQKIKDCNLEIEAETHKLQNYYAKLLK